MRIYSWNMLFRNARQDRALAFILKSDFDIFCLQEVPEEFLERLKKHFAHLAYATETDRFFDGTVSTQYLVIISRFPFIASLATPIGPRAASAPKRTGHFVRLMVALRLWGEGRGNRNRLYAEFRHPKVGTVGIHNLHLPLKHPQWRAEELDALLATLNTQQPTIICGDFNILESPHISILNWILGGHFSDVLLWKRERKQLEKKFIECGLSNPLRGKSTHPISFSQLDHILLSSTLPVTKSGVSRERYGSDHAPIWVETA